MSNPQRFGIVIGTNPDKLDLYKKVHADAHPGVRDLLIKYNIRNFSIFIHTLPDNKEYLFGCYEYTGNDYESDMAALAKEPRNIEWLAMCDPCQVPLPGEKSWARMRQIYYNA